MRKLTSSETFRSDRDTQTTARKAHVIVTMVQCAALNCTIKSGQGLSMYLFPRDPKFRKIWTLRLKRDGFEPSQYTKLCERHFDKDQFSVNPDVANNVGFQVKSKMLKPGAIPSIFDYTNPKEKSLKRSASQSTKSVIRSGRISTAIEKIAKRRRYSVRFSVLFFLHINIQSVNVNVCLLHDLSRE